MKPRRENGPDSEAVVFEADRLLGVREAAELLSVKVSTLYQWKYQRKIPFIKLLGKALRFRRSAILQLITDCETPALADRPDEE